MDSLLSSTERLPEYECIQFFNKLSNNIKRVNNLKQVKTHISDLILNLELYLVKDFLELNDI